MEQHPGKQVGEWRCIKVLGKGSFGIVGLWKNSRNGQQAAIKQFEIRNPRATSSHVLLELKERWKNEVDIMNNLVDSCYVVSTICVPECFVQSNLEMPLLCLEYCVGGDLRQLLKRPENIAGLPEEDVRNFLDHIGQAILYLHERNIIHRDIKCENVLISIREEGYKKVQTFKLGDLGFAKDLTDSQSLCSTVVGTLQYLAPEIYMGKRYDKTVDYWSFGLIAFEVSCGMRPFLHGESPSQWIPYVEEKERDVICIHRGEDGAVEFSKKIPYDTHLTEMFKQCLESWLKIMLQLDPTKRGCKISSPQELTESGREQNIYGLTSLPVMLRQKKLEMKTPIKRLGFVIGRSTTILDIQNLLSRQLGLTVENQLILAIDGALVKGNELASKYTNFLDLYLIPKIMGWYRMKIKLPKIVHNFLDHNDQYKEPNRVRKVWRGAIYFMQSELEKFEILRKMSNALRLRMTSTVISDLKYVSCNVEKGFNSLKTIMELERKLNDLESSFGYDCKVFVQSGELTVQNHKEEVGSLEKYYKDCLDWFPENTVLIPTASTSELEEVYHKTLKYYDDWRTVESNTGMLEHLLRGLCQFIAQRDPIIESLTKNITVQLERIEEHEKSIDKLKNLSTKLEAIIYEVMRSRCEKQKKLLIAVIGEQRGLSEEKSSINDKIESAYAVPNNNNRMSKSDAAPMKANIGMEILPTLTTAFSLDASKSVSKFSMADIMQDSQILQFETADILTKCTDKLNRLLKETEDMDWEFV